MDNYGLIVLTGIATAAAVAGAVFAWVQARAAVHSREDAQLARNEAQDAQGKAETAQAQANAIAGQARDALERSAVALERANELAEAAIPQPQVRWRISPLPGGMWAVKNVGDLTASNVTLSGGPGIYTDEDSSASVVRPGHALRFGIWQGGGMAAPVLTVAWDDSDGERQEEPITVLS